MPVQLTETAITKAIRDLETKGRHDLADAGLPGLRLRLTPNGSRTWALACRDREGRMRRFKLGSYPEMGIAAARNAARRMKLDVGAGIDPIAEGRRMRAIAKAGKDGIGTLTALLNLYFRRPAPGISAGPGHVLKSGAKQRQAIETVFGKHLSRPLAFLTAQDLQMTADGWASAQSAGAAVRYLRPILKWASRSRNYAPSTLAEIQPPTAPKRRERVLAAKELRALLPVLGASPRPYAAALRMMLLTLARREEVCSMEWRHVDLAAARWTIPAPKTKNSREHVVPLARQAVALLRDIRPEKPKAAALVFATETGGRLANWDRETKALMTTSGTKGWTRHDLRRTGATLMGELGFDPHVIEAALNHSAIHSQLAATYNKTRYLPEVAKAMQTLADRLDGVVQGGADVVPLRPAG